MATLTTPTDPPILPVAAADPPIVERQTMRTMHVAVFVGMIFGVRRPALCDAGDAPGDGARNAGHDLKTEDLRRIMAREIENARRSVVKGNMALAEAAAALVEQK